MLKEQLPCAASRRTVSAPQPPSTEFPLGTQSSAELMRVDWGWSSGASLPLFDKVSASPEHCLPDTWNSGMCLLWALCPGGIHLSGSRPVHQPLPGQKQPPQEGGLIIQSLKAGLEPHHSAINMALPR